MLDKEWFCNSSVTSESQLVLFCLPFAGGSGEYYLPWRLKMSEQIAVIPVQYPGRSYRRMALCYTRADNFVADFVEKIKPFILSGQPFGFFGHSMGGYLLYCISKSLQQQKLPLPSLNFISSTPSPEQWAGQRSVIGMSEAEFNEIYLGLGGIDDAFLQYPEFMAMQMRILRQDIEMVETCLCEDSFKLQVPLVSLGAVDDHHVSSHSIEKWSEFTEQHCTTYQFEGGHFYLNKHQDQVINIIEVHANKYIQQVTDDI